MSNEPQAEQNNRSWTEAPSSATVKAKYGGREWMITMRAERVGELIKQIDTINEWLDRHAEAVNVEPTPPEVKATQTTTTPAPQKSTPQSTLHFEVERIEANVSAGKVSWRVKGGHFAQYGVICWPEVIKAAELQLDPAVGAYNMTGWIAEYVTKEDGKPQKVTRLYKAQA